MLFGTDQTPILTVVSQTDGTYAIEAKMPRSHATILTRFTTRAEAEDWITDFRRRRELSKNR
jgi:hypothetical protein